MVKMHGIRVLMACVTMHCVYVSVCQCICDDGVESCNNGHCKVVTLQTLSLFHNINVFQQLNIF